MKNNLDIENLFRNTLENAGVEPPAGAWEAIQTKMGMAATASTAGTTVSAGLGVGKIAAIVITSLGIGMGAGYFTGKVEQPKAQQMVVEQPQSITGNNTAIAENNTGISNTPAPKAEITKVTTVSKNDKVVSIVEVKTGESTKTIRVESNGSVANQWLSPKKDKVSRDEMIQRIMDELEKEEPVSEPVHTAKEPTVIKEKDMVVSAQEVNNDHVEAGINMAVNPLNSLQVTFSNFTQASAYDWDFGDNTTSKQANPVHTYKEPGTYAVTVKVSNKAGKTFTETSQVQVKAREEDLSSFAGTIPNTFTPNGDGMNDRIRFESQNIVSFTFMVYNSTTGKMVYSSNDVNMSWDGTDNGGNQLPEGLYKYVYKAVGKDGKEYKNGSDLRINR